MRAIVRSVVIDPMIDERLPICLNYYGEMVWILMMLEQLLDGRKHRPSQIPPQNIEPHAI